MNATTAARDQNLVHATKPQLLAFVLSIIGQPIDAFAIAAVLETYGLRDIDARERFQADNIFALAEELFEECRRRAVRYPHIPPNDGEETRASRWKRFATLYARALLSNAPWTLQIASLLIFGYAFGVYAQFDGKQATMAGVGMMLGLFASGGFGSALGRLASFYNGQHSYALTRQAYYRVWTLGVAALALSALALDAVNWQLALFPEEYLIIGLAYYFACGVMSLTLTLFYTLNNHAGLFFSTLAGVAAMILVMEFTPLSMYMAHWIGFFTTSGVGFFWISRILRRKTAQMSAQQRNVHLPRLRSLAPSVAPYFLTGTLYFGFLLTDRIVSWSLAPEGISLRLWIRKEYEILLLWAFAAFSLLLPLLECIGDDFLRFIAKTQRRFGIESKEAHNRLFIERYLRYWLTIACAAVPIGVAVYNLHSLAVEGFPYLPSSATTNPAIARQVAAFGIVGYSFFIWGLMNALILSALAQPSATIKAFCWGILCNASVGLWLSRSFGFWYSIVGMTFGSLVFAVVSSFAVARTLRSMDYSVYTVS